MKNADKPINPAHILIKEGGNAFLVSAEGANRGNYTIGNLGLSKREHFAGLAMQGLLANCNGGMTSGGSYTFSPNGISELAILHADELLKQLENK